MYLSVCVARVQRQRDYCQLNPNGRQTLQPPTAFSAFGSMGRQPLMNQEHVIEPLDRLDD